MRNGYGLFMDGTTLVFDKFTQGATIALNWGELLVSFSPRLSMVGQLNKVTVRGWDIKQKREIVGEKTSSTTHPSIGLGKSGGQAVNAAISKQPTLSELRRSVTTQAEAETIAQGLLDKVNAGFIEADGVALGNPGLVAGAKVQLGKLSTKFNGTYVVSVARHMYEEGTYMTEFRIEGYQPKMLGDLLQTSSNSPQTWNGVVVGIVTNNNDSEGGMARVKLKYPWLADDKESGWARVATMGAGNDRGFLWMPEVNDEVLVAFENGDFNRPYVIGSLYNGRDKPHESTFFQDGKIELRTIKTRAGHIIRLNDKSGEEKIEIIDANTKTSIVMDTANEKVTIMAGKDIHIEGTSTSMMLKSKDITLDATNKVIIKAASGIDITSSGTLNMKSTGAMSIESTAAMTVKGTASLSLQSSGTAELKANGPLTISSTAITEVKGSMVKIN
jgi:uncharacterized protein involved in type VI secretion and phage assembly